MIKFILKIILLSLCVSLQAQEIRIDELKVKCDVKNACEQQVFTFRSLKRTFSSPDHLHKILKLYVSNEGVKSLDYTLEKVDENYHLVIHMTPKPRIVEFDGVSFDKGDFEIPAVLPVREDDYFDLARVKQTKAILLELAKDKGYPKAKVQERVKRTKKGVVLGFDIEMGEPIIVAKININSNSEYLKNILQNIMGEYTDNPYDLSAIKTTLETVRNLFLQYGYYLAEIDIKSRVIGARRVYLFLNVKNTKLYTFYVKGVDKNKIEFIKKELSESLIGFKREMSLENIEQRVHELLQSYGIINSLVKIGRSEFKTKNNEENIVYKIEIEKGHKASIGTLSFKGNTFFSHKELKELFYTDATSLVSNHLHDPSYYEAFVEKLKKYFISYGFLSVFIEKPQIEYVPSSHTYHLTYKIREGMRTQISTIQFGELPEELREEILADMHNKPGKYFNPIAFEEDLTKITKNLKARGYYFAEIRNLNTPGIVNYKQDNAYVDININVYAGEKIYANEIIIIGNLKTKKSLILRELEIEKDVLVTSERIQNSQTNLLSLGIFNSVQISPVENDRSHTDVLVFVREKDFGFIELAPGIRTDLGAKLSMRINYNNLEGMNKKITFRGSINRRLNLNVLDEEREKEGKTLLEYDATVDYAENHIFKSDYDFTASVSKQRRRFFSFDADIQRISSGVSYDVTRWLNLSARYQLETISQFNASVDRDRGHFQIGSITPSIFFDFRNRSVNATQGASIGLSCEFANPALLSQSNDDLTIDYYKLINRNRFYYPFSQDVVLAVSTAFGIQENLANEKNASGEVRGYIPNIKVFRLNGADIVRGYEEDEINRLVSKQDIAEVEVNNRAYMANIKVEPRLFLSDTTMLGVFYDAGRIFVNEFKEDELRSSVGLSFKYLTPVGSLDFDYGIKLLRKRDADGTLDSPGRLHVSIGFF